MENSYFHADRDTLLRLLAAYDEYIIEACDEGRFDTGWRPACVSEFYESDYDGPEGREASAPPADLGAALDAASESLEECRSAMARVLLLASPHLAGSNQLLMHDALKKAEEATAVLNEAQDAMARAGGGSPAPSGLTRLWSEYRAKTGWQGLDAESAIESFVSYCGAHGPASQEGRALEEYGTLRWMREDFAAALEREALPATDENIAALIGRLRGMRDWHEEAVELGNTGIEIEARQMKGAMCGGIDLDMEAKEAKDASNALSNPTMPNRKEDR